MAQLVAQSLVILFLILAVGIAYGFKGNLKQEMEYTIFKRRYDICHLPLKTGSCRHRVKAYYYNYVTKRCDRFYYTLCDGNANRFYTDAECMEFCNNYKYVFKVQAYDQLPY